MEKTLKIQIERLPEGVFLATSDEIQGLIAQGRTISETIEIARDLAKKLLEEQQFDTDILDSIEDKFSYPIVIGF